MFVELHIIQNFAPANLNRSDTGSPKDCVFGGYRRARVSSQCFKRAMRDYFKQDGAFANSQKELLAVRTKRLLDEITKRLIARDQAKDEAERVVTDEAEARRVIESALNGVKLTVKEDSKTQYLLFLGNEEINKIAALCLEHYVSLKAIAPKETTDTKTSAKDKKKAAKDAVPSEVRTAMEKVLDGGKAVDLALFGRMLADLPTKNVDASSQVAHAVSTHKVEIEFDFYTAVDDIKPEDTSGADMLGTIEFNSACFYRYANVDVEQLKKNLGKDEELTKASIEAFIRAAINAIPTGKQNSMAAQQMPSFVLAVARNSGLWSLANAFEKPVRPMEQEGLVETSIQRLDGYWKDVASVFDSDSIKEQAYVKVGGEDLPNLNGSRVGSVKELVEKIGAAIVFRQETAK